MLSGRVVTVVVVVVVVLSPPQSLDERRKKLSAMEERTAKVADAASDYSSLATQLAKKYERK